MDPSAAELAGMADLTAVLAWVGPAGGVFAGLRVAVGDFQLVREILLIPSTTWDASIAATRVQS